MQKIGATQSGDARADSCQNTGIALIVPMMASVFTKTRAMIQRGVPVSRRVPNSWYAAMGTGRKSQISPVHEITLSA